MMNRRRYSSLEEPTDIAILMQNLLDTPVIRDGMRATEIISRWHEIVGEVVAQQVIPVDIIGGFLVLKAHSAVWKSEVNWQKKAILERSNALLGREVVRAIRFV